MKDNIFALLKSNGFIIDGDTASHDVNKVVGETIINGTHQPQYQKVNIRITYIGDGWIGEDAQYSRPTTQWNLNINGNDIGDFIVETVEDFKQIFNI